MASGERRPADSNVFDDSVRRANFKEAGQFFERVPASFGKYLDLTPGQVTRVAAKAEVPGTFNDEGAKENALNTAGNDGPQRGGFDHHEHGPGGGRLPGFLFLAFFAVLPDNLYLRRRSQDFLRGYADGVFLRFLRLAASIVSFSHSNTSSAVRNNPSAVRF